MAIFLLTLSLVHLLLYVFYKTKKANLYQVFFTGLLASYFFGVYLQGIFYNPLYICVYDTLVFLSLPFLFLGLLQLEKRLSTPVRADVVPLQRPGRAGQRALLAAALAVLFVVCAAPLLAIVWRAVAAGPNAWAVVFDGEVGRALWNTLRFSLAALLLATALGLAHAFAARRSVWLRTAAFLPFVVSPVTVAFGLLLLYPSWTASLPLLIAAYALLAYPFVAKSVASALDSLPVQVLQAAQTLGATPWRVFWRVTLPMIAPALRRGMAFAAATVLGEFAVTLFLSRPEWATLTTLMYQRLGRPGAANLDAAMVLACLLMALALLAFMLIEASPAKAEGRDEAHSRRVLNPSRSLSPPSRLPHTSPSPSPAKELPVA